MPEAGAALALAGVSAGYGETVVIEDACFELAPGESISIIGRNGVGKTTLLETIMGHTALHGGTVRLNGRDITRARPYHRVRAGLGYVPQEREIFRSLTVMENLRVAARPAARGPERVFELFPRLHERREHLGSQLSGGEQQMLAIGRALVTAPSVLLMDEPSEGLAPVVVEALSHSMARLRDEESISIVLVEQNTRIALDFCARCLVMSRGRIVRDGPTRELAEQPELLDRLVGLDVAR